MSLPVPAAMHQPPLANAFLLAKRPWWRPVLLALFAAANTFVFDRFTRSAAEAPAEAWCPAEVPKQTPAPPPWFAAPSKELEHKADKAPVGVQGPKPPAPAPTVESQLALLSMAVCAIWALGKRRRASGPLVRQPDAIMPPDPDEAKEAEGQFLRMRHTN